MVVQKVVSAVDYQDDQTDGHMVEDSATKMDQSLVYWTVSQMVEPKVYVDFEMVEMKVDYWADYQDV